MNGTKARVLHVTPHLGGGVGRVLMNYLLRARQTSRFEHDLVCLDYANDGAVAWAKTHRFPVEDRIASRWEDLRERMNSADIVLVHWWNHPLLFDLLVRRELPASRLIFWSHISGFHPPYVFSEKVLSYPDQFVFTTPVSFETDLVASASSSVRARMRAIWATGGLEHVCQVQARPHEGFQVGYVGTVDYAKLHPEFLDICSRIQIPGVRFVVCGGSSERTIRQQAVERGIAERFEFTGLISNVAEYFSTFDVFGYPLARHHYGTCDLALAESMGAGVVPVVLANRMEVQMVKHNVVGYVANTPEEYVEAIIGLYNNRDKRRQMAENARQYAQQTFSIDKMIEEWDRAFSETLRYDPRPRSWPLEKSGDAVTPADVFLEALSSHGQPFRAYATAKSDSDRSRCRREIRATANSAIWKSETRGTPRHYLSFFPGDNTLKAWDAVIHESSPGENQP